MTPCLRGGSILSARITTPLLPASKMHTAGMSPKFSSLVGSSPRICEAMFSAATWAMVSAGKLSSASAVDGQTHHDQRGRLDRGQDVTSVGVLPHVLDGQGVGLGDGLADHPLVAPDLSAPRRSHPSPPPFCTLALPVVTRRGAGRGRTWRRTLGLSVIAAPSRGCSPTSRTGSRPSGWFRPRSLHRRRRRLPER